MPLYDEKYTKVKVKEFNGVVNTNFLNEELPKGVHHTCKASISIDSVMKMEKNNYPQVYLEECKYEVKEKKMSKFRDINLESDSDSEW